MTLNLREIKKLTPSYCLKQVTDQLTSAERSFLNDVIFYNWSSIKAVVMTSAHIFTHLYPDTEKKPLVSTAVKHGIEAYRQSNSSYRVGTESERQQRPGLFFTAFMKKLVEYKSSQPTGFTMDRSEYAVWHNIDTPLPIWIKRNNLQILQFEKTDRESRPWICDLMLGCKITPDSGWHVLTDYISRMQVENQIKGPKDAAR